MQNIVIITETKQKSIVNFHWKLFSILITEMVMYLILLLIDSVAVGPNISNNKFPFIFEKYFHL